VEHRFAFHAHAAAGEPRHDAFQRQLIADYGVEFDAAGLKNLSESFGLCNRPGKAVQQKPAPAAETSRAFGDQRQHSIIRNEFAFSHAFERAFYRGGEFVFIGVFGGTENITG
jgi:hypothetical protein